MSPTTTATGWTSWPRSTRGLGGAVKGAAGHGLRGAGSLLADVLAEAAPRLRIRDAAMLRVHHPGLSDDEIADVLIRNAARTTAAFGAAIGALAAVEFAAPPTLLAAPVQLAAETLAVAAVEVKLIAELHEVLGQPAFGTGSQRGSAYLMSWVRQRALDPKVGAAGLTALLGVAAKRELRTMLVRRAGRSVTHAGPVPGRRGRRRHRQPPGDQVAGREGDRRAARPAVLIIGLSGAGVTCALCRHPFPSRRRTRRCEVLVQRLDPGVPLPAYALPGDAGADVVTTVDAELAPGERAVLPTGPGPRPARRGMRCSCTRAPASPPAAACRW